jgi:large subunit ribosomal protein L35
MPKIKTNRSAAKRFKPTGSGKFMYNKSHHRHILTTKSRKRKRQMKNGAVVATSDLLEIKRLLPNG